MKLEVIGVDKQLEMIVGGVLSEYGNPHGDEFEIAEFTGHVMARSIQAQLAADQLIVDRLEAEIERLNKRLSELLDSLHEKATWIDPKRLTRRQFLSLPVEIRREILSHYVTEEFDNISDEERLKELHRVMD